MNSNRNPNQKGAQAPIRVQQYDPEKVWAFENDWNTKLCDCKPMGRCCYGCWCPCCLGCDIGKYTGEGKCAGCCVCCTLEHMRTKLRVARRIEGSCCGDCFTARCCFPCVMVQMSRELESQGLWDPPKESQPKPKPRS